MNACSAILALPLLASWAFATQANPGAVVSTIKMNAITTSLKVFVCKCLFSSAPRSQGVDLGFVRLRPARADDHTILFFDGRQEAAFSSISKTYSIGNNLRQNEPICRELPEKCRKIRL